MIQTATDNIYTQEIKSVELNIYTILRKFSQENVNSIFFNYTLVYAVCISDLLKLEI